MSTLVHDLKKEAAAVASLLSSYRTIFGDDEELKLSSIEGETSLYEMAQACIDRKDEIDILIAGIDQKIGDFESRKSRFLSQIEGLRAALLNALEAAEQKKLELPTATIYTSKGRDAIGTYDEAELPAKYFRRPEPVVDKKALLDDLKAGIPVKGATLKNGTPILNIKSR